MIVSSVHGGLRPTSLVQAQFSALAASLGGENAHFAFFYDESLSHLIYAGCDIIAVPSMFEPCGLTQVLLMPIPLAHEQTQLLRERCL